MSVPEDDKLSRGKDPKWAIAVDATLGARGMSRGKP